MSKKLNLLILVLFLISSFFLISTNVNANGNSCEIHEDGWSGEWKEVCNCCEARESKCRYVREGELGQIAEYTCESYGDGDDMASVYDYDYGDMAGCAMIILVKI